MAIPAIVLGLLACDTAPDSPLLPPIGRHEVRVGETWTHRLQVLGSARPPLQWSVVRGPGGLQVLGAGDHADLVWTPDVFRLGPRKPGQPRVAGPEVPVEVRLTDGDGHVATSQGVLRVVPTPLPPGIDAPARATLALGVHRVLRLPVRTDTTALAGAPVALHPESPAGAELIAESKGRYLLRYRPDDAALRAGPVVQLRLAAPDWQAPLAEHTLEVELVGRDLPLPCVLHAPHLQVAVPPQLAAGAPLPVAVTALDADSPVAAVHALLAAAQDGPSPVHAPGHGAILGAKSGVPTPAGAASLPLEVPVSASVVAVWATATDLDDPLFDVCRAQGRWPDRGAALVGVGPGCSDDALPAGAEAPLSLQPGEAVLRRHCPDVPDVFAVPVAAGIAPGVRLSTPPGWPQAAFTVHDGPTQLCAGDGAGRPCWLPPQGTPRVLQVTVTAAAPGSSRLEIGVLASGCAVAAAGAPLAAVPGQTVPWSLCPGERRRLQAQLAAAGRVRVDLACAGGAFVLAYGGADLATGAVTDLGGRALFEPWLEPGTWLDVRASGPAPLDCELRLGPAAEPGPRRDDPHALDIGTPLRLPTRTGLAIDAARPRALLLALNADDLGQLAVPGAATLQAEPAPLGSDGLLGPLLPWLVGEPGARPGGGWQAQVGPGPGLSAWTVQAAAGPAGRVLARAELTAASPCSPDRADALADSPKTPVHLQPPGARAQVLAGLRVCPGDDDWFRLQAAADAVVEVAVLASGPLPVLHLDAGPGETCQLLPVAPDRAPWPLQAKAVAVGRCWLREAGAVAVQISPASAPATYDLVWRAR